MSPKVAARCRAVARWLAVTCAALLLCGAGLAVSVMHLLRPAPGEWSHSVTLGRWQFGVSLPTLLRMATHPFTLGLIEGRRLGTRFGPVTVSAGARPGTWVVVCAPCSIAPAELGRDRIRLARVEVTLQRDVQMNLHGTLRLGDASAAVAGRWRARSAASQIELQVDLPAAPLRDAFGLFASEIPELARAHIEGSVGVAARWRWPSRQFDVKPVIEGFRVAGLGTEALLGAVPACAARSAGLAPGLWLPRAVVAAEDQRFYEHSGFDLTEIGAAGSGDAGPRHADGERLRGASTLSQQLAKLVYTGDRPSHVRKLRELLYAVELDRTLGKARVLDLYLALAPWGDGQCGADAAALHLLGKPAVALGLVEAAWLASLLRNPNAALAEMARSGTVDVRRVGRVIEAMRPLSPARRARLRADLPAWRPAWLGPPAGAVPPP